MTTPDAIADARTGTREESARCIADPARAEFMRRLMEHEDTLIALVRHDDMALIEPLRMTRRAVVAAYDRATLRAEELSRAPNRPETRTIGDDSPPLGDVRPHDGRDALGTPVDCPS